MIKFKYGDEVRLKKDPNNIHEVVGEDIKTGKIIVKHDKYKGIPYGLRESLSYTPDELLLEPQSRRSKIYKLKQEVDSLSFKSDNDKLQNIIIILEDILNERPS